MGNLRAGHAPPRLRSLILALALLPCLLSARGVGAGEAPDASVRQSIEEIIRDYLLKNPEVIEQSLQVLERRRQEAEKQRRREAVRAHLDELLRDPGSPVGGNPQGDVTVVEFFDYRCSYCKGVAGAVKTLLEEDRSVRLVYKDFPILGPESEVAARAALAAQRQGEYVALHDALMAADGPLGLALVLEIAGQVGLDVGKLRADMELPEIRAAIERNRKLGEALDIDGTPAFVVGSELVPGAMDLHALKALVSQARSK